MPDDSIKMGRDRTLLAQDRLMARVDYYLHCELDEEYDRDRPEVARAQLEAALRRELLRASSSSSSSSSSEARGLDEPDELRNAVKEVVGKLVGGGAENSPPYRTAALCKSH